MNQRRGESQRHGERGAHSRGGDGPSHRVHRALPPRHAVGHSQRISDALVRTVRRGRPRGTRRVRVNRAGGYRVAERTRLRTLRVLERAGEAPQAQQTGVPRRARDGGDGSGAAGGVDPAVGAARPANSRERAEGGAAVDAAGAVVVAAGDWRKRKRPVEVHATAPAAPAPAPAPTPAVRRDSAAGIDGERAGEDDHRAAAATAAAPAAHNRRRGNRRRYTRRRLQERGRGVAARTPVRAHLPAVEDDQLAEWLEPGAENDDAAAAAAETGAVAVAAAASNRRGRTRRVRTPVRATARGDRPGSGGVRRGRGEAAAAGTAVSSPAARAAEEAHPFTLPLPGSAPGSVRGDGGGVGHGDGLDGIHVHGLGGDDPALAHDHVHAVTQLKRKWGAVSGLARNRAG